MKFKQREEEPVVVNADERAVALKEIEAIMMGLKALHEGLQTKIEIGYAKDILGLMEHGVKKIGGAIHVETQTAADIEERHRDIRKANLRVRELEEQMGLMGDIEVLPRKMEVLSRKLNHWWDVEGFGHILELRFTGYGACEIELNGSLCFPRGFMSDTPISDIKNKADWIESLKKRGFKLNKPGERRDTRVLDNDHNRNILFGLIKKDFPSANIYEWKSRGGQSDAMASTLDSIRLMINDIKEIDALPMKPKPAEEK